MEKNNLLPACRQCPGADFELLPLANGRFMAVCHARESVLEPYFPDTKSRFLSKATMDLAVFTPLENCPLIEDLRTRGIVPWVSATIDFTK